LSAAALAPGPSPWMPASFREMEDFERELGSPYDPEAPISFCRAAELDEREEFPEEASQRLFAAGLREHYVPASLGGRLESFEALMLRLRALSRRDATLALVEFANLFGSVPVWVAGSDAQRRKAVETLRSGRRLAAAFHEKAHGSDVLANDLRADRVPGGWRLSGEKWCISGGLRSQVYCVFARTGAANDTRGYSLLMVDKADLPEGTCTPLPKLRTLGVRGADLSGVRFAGAPVSSDAIVGAEGAGLEVMLRGFQITRTLFSSLALGLADTALRLALEFVVTRRLYGDRVIALPYTRKLIADAFLDLLVADCLGLAATRALDTATAQASIYALVVKSHLPEALEGTIRSLFSVLGARAFLREGFRWGMFQKVLRDYAGLRVGHFNTAVSLSQLGAQLTILSRSNRAGPGRAAQVAEGLAALFDLERAPRGFDPRALALANRGRDDLLEGLDQAREAVEGLREPEAEVRSRLGGLAAELVSERDRQHDQLVALTPTRPAPALQRSAELFDVARASAALHAGAAALHMWLANRERLGEFFGRGEWLCLALDRLCVGFHRRPLPAPAGWVDVVVDEACARLREDRLFSIVPAALPATPAPAPGDAQAEV
jgi:alkylation response protein AidB-like acyl-CoA dehydrogenase